MTGKPDEDDIPKATQTDQNATNFNPTFTRIFEFQENYDYIFRICLLGDPSVGKTSLLTRYCDLTFKDNYNTTIGVDFKVITLQFQNMICKVHVWDTAGQERFKSLAVNYFRTSNGFMFVYDITSDKTFCNVTQWTDVAFANSKQAHVNFLIGNKCDKGGERQVSKEKGEALAKTHNFVFFETSAFDSTNVDKAFELIIYNLIKYHDSFNRKKTDNNNNIQLDTQDKIENISLVTKKKCCL